MGVRDLLGKRAASKCKANKATVLQTCAQMQCIGIHRLGEACQEGNGNRFGVAMRQRRTRQGSERLTSRGRRWGRRAGPARPGWPQRQASVGIWNGGEERGGEETIILTKHQKNCVSDSLMGRWNIRNLYLNMKKRPCENTEINCVAAIYRRSSFFREKNSHQHMPQL